MNGITKAGCVLLLLGSVQPIAAAEAIPAPDLSSVGFDQRLDQQIPLDLVFFDEAGKPVKLGDDFRDKPVILVLAYYRCPMLCTLVLNGVADAMSKMPLRLGEDYHVVTVSFDPRETWELAAAKRKTYLARYRREGAGEDWHFLTGKAEAIKKLTEAVGFRFVYDAKNDQFLHVAGIVVATPAGKIARYLYGVQFPERDLRLALVEASANKIGSRVDQVLLYCFHYDPAAGKYSPAVMNFVRAGGVLTIAAVIGLVLLLRRRRPGRDLPRSDGVQATAPEDQPREAGHER